MDVSVVVLTWEDHVRTAACVASLPTDAEILVVDNGSGPEVAERLRQLDAVYVRSEENLGYAKGMNLGIRHSTRSVVVLANNDLVVHPGAVGRLAAALDDPAVGAAFPAILNTDGSDGTGGGRFLTMRVGLGHLTGLGMLFPALRLRTSPANADWLSGPFVALRRETLDRIGGVDESAHFYSEDLRLCWAVHELGLTLARVPEAVVTHEDDSSARRRWDRAEISLRQTRELIRASRDQGGLERRIACAAYAYGAVLRSWIAPGVERRAIARGALEGLRS
jgi:N-acetylglucosaminyl-diphospho-decaprenol L-rhamnosyltransferase